MGNKKLLRALLQIVVISLMIINADYVVSAKEQMNFKNITIEEGLPQGTVEALFQDSKGYIWIGTNDGLSRYNGYQFKVFRVEEDSENSLVNNYILDIKEDSDGNMWIATANGLSKIHKDGQTISNYLVGEENGNLSHANTNTILITKDNTILVGTADGLNIYDEATDSFSRIFEGDKLTQQYINCLVEDKYGDIWVGTENGISKINLSTGKSEHLLHDENENSISENDIYKLYYDYKGYVWAGTYSKGACRIDIRTNEVLRFYKDENDNKSLAGDFVKGFLRDNKGNMWIGTDNGLSKYNDSNRTFTNYVNKIYDRNSLVDNNIFSIIQDKTGLLWLGTYSGISIFNPEIKIQHYKNDPFDDTTISSNMVSALYEDDEGLLWIGTSDNCIDILNRDSERVISLKDEDYKGVVSSVIFDISGNNQYIFIATNNGFCIVNKAEKTIKYYNESNGIPNRSVRCIFYDDLGYLWIGTSNGLAILNLETDEITDITNILEKYSPNDKFIGDIYKDKDGEYWIGTFIQGGLIRINPHEKKVTVYNSVEDDKSSISNNSIRVITEGTKEEIWVGTSFGLNKFNKEREEFTRYTTKDGMSNNTIYGILIDSYGNPWCSTNVGISKVDIKRNSITNLDITDGLQSNEFNGNAYFENSNGEFIFGGINGFNIFEPEKIVENKYIHGLTFDEFKVNGLEVGNIDKEKLDHDKNNIYIEAFLPNYKNINGIQYYYILEGGTNEWIPMETNSVTLSNLSPGDYVFRIRARSSNGIISDESKVTFTINPPFWASKYAIFIYILIIVLFIINQKYKVKKLDDMVSLKTNELSDEMRRNNELFKKVIKLEKNKNNYLINMSHELRTPLNVIYSTEQLIRELNKADEGIDREKLNDYMGIMRNNAKRLLKIINDLIDSSKIEHGSYRIEIKEVDIVYIVEEAALSLREYIEGKGINLIVDPEMEEKIIEADSGEIERCIVNIVSNAGKFTRAGGNIEVNIKDLDNFVKIEIIDDGIGIDKEFHKLIFNRFNQVVDKNAEVKGGSGLGLTITKKIIDIHNGDIYVESEAGKGSKFTIILPVKQKKE